MPLYEFACCACDTVFEELVQMGSKGEGLTCPQCSRTKLRKLMSTFSGRVADSHGSSHSCAGGGNCGGDCGGCGGNCTCH